MKGKNQNEMLAAWVKTFEGKDDGGKDDGVKTPSHKDGNRSDGSERREGSERGDAVYENLGDDVKEGSLVVDKDDRLCIAQYGKAVPLAVNANKV